MNKRFGILTLLPIFLSIIFFSPVVTHVDIPVAHASPVGEVCIADITQTSCPINPETLNTTITLTTNKATQFKVAVLVNSSASFNGFDIVILTNPAILKPANVSNNGLFATGTIDAECIGTKSFTSIPTCPAYDTAGTVEFAAHGSYTLEPTTGLIFTAVYNITSTTPTTPIGFQTGCSGTSTPPLCITISNGSTGAVPETSQPGSFSNSAYYSMTTSVASLVVFQGATDTSTTVTLTSLNNFVGTVNLSTSTAGPSGIVASLAPFTSLALKADAQNNTGLVITVPQAAPVGSNSVTITGMSSPLPNNSVTIKIIVPPPDFSIRSSRGTLISMNATTTTNTTIIFTSGGGFTGTVSLSRTVQQPPNPPVAGNIANLTATLNVTTVVLTSPGSSAALLTVTSPSGFYDYGDFFVNITATSGSITHFIVVKIIVADFTMNASPTSLTMIQGTTSGNTLTFTQQPTAQDFFGQINVTTTAPSGSGITASCSPRLINFTRSGSSSPTTACSFRALQAGTFTVTLRGTAKIQFSATPLSHSLSYSITVTGPDFSITALTTRFPGILPGSQPANTTTVQVSSIARFNGTLTLSLLSNATGLISTLSKYTVMVNSTRPNVNVILTIQTASGTAPQSYGITVSATNGTLSTCCTRTVLVTVLVVDFGISASPTTVGPLLPSVPTNVNVTISPIHGYGASTVLTTIPSAGLTVSPSTTTLSKPGLVTLSVSSSILGTYSLTIIAKNGPVSHNVTITVLVNARPDLAIGLVSTSPNTVTIGGTVTFTIEVQNKGPIPENATVAALAGDLTVANKTILLQPYTNQNITLVWNTNGFSAGAYVVGAKVLQVPNESNTDNNLLRSGTAVTLNSASNAFILSQDQPIIVGLAVGLVAAVAVAVLLARRLTMKTKTQSS